MTKIQGGDALFFQHCQEVVDVFVGVVFHAGRQLLIQRIDLEERVYIGEGNVHFCQSIPEGGGVFHRKGYIHFGDHIGQMTVVQAITAVYITLSQQPLETAVQCYVNLLSGKGVIVSLFDFGNGQAVSGTQILQLLIGDVI